MKPALFITLLACALTACKGNSGGAVADEIALAAPQEKNITLTDKKLSEPPPVASIDTSKKLIKEGNISFEAADLKATRGKILASLKQLGGYLSEEQERSGIDEHQKQVILSLRVPSKNFDQLLESISGDADKIDSKNISIKDVTTQYMD